MRRATILALFLFTTGAIAMSEPVIAQETKDDKKPKPRKGMGDEKVSLRAWDKQRSQFLKAQDDIDASRKDTDKKGLAFTLSGRGVVPITGHPTIGSEITDKDGRVYIVNKVTKGGMLYICYVTLKEMAKKPD